MLPSNFAAQVDASTWTAPSVFTWLAKAGAISTEELAKTFNMGIGMVLIVSAEEKENAISVLLDHGEEVYEIGHLVKRDEGKAQCMVKRSEVWTV